MNEEINKLFKKFPGRLHNLEPKRCVKCNKWFLKRKKSSTKISCPPGVRNNNAVTCSKRCSKSRYYIK